MRCSNIRSRHRLVTSSFISFSPSVLHFFFFLFIFTTLSLLWRCVSTTTRSDAFVSNVLGKAENILFLFFRLFFFSRFLRCTNTEINLCSSRFQSVVFCLLLSLGLVQLCACPVSKSKATTFRVAFAIFSHLFLALYFSSFSSCFSCAHFRYALSCNRRMFPFFFAFAETNERIEFERKGTKIGQPQTHENNL